MDLREQGNISLHSSKIKNNWKVSLIDTGYDSMTGYRLKLLSNYIKEDQFMLTYGVASVNINELVDFHNKQNTIGTVTGVFPTSRFGDMKAKAGLVTSFKEKETSYTDGKMINGGFFIFKKEFLELIPNDPKCDLEREPLEKITKMGQLSVHLHKEFWQCMDTYRDFMLLNAMWENDPKWKIW